MTHLQSIYTDPRKASDTDLQLARETLEGMIRVLRTSGCTHDALRAHWSHVCSVQYMRGTQSP